MTPRPRVILVVGPPLAGVGGVLRALRSELPEHVVVGTGGLEPPQAPDAVVAVVSAVAPLVGSDWALIQHAAGRTDLLVGAVSKIDAHRGWRAVLQKDRELVAGWAPRRAPMPWVGVAAAPHLGDCNVAELVAALRAGLDDPTLARRNAERRNDQGRATDRSPQVAGATSASPESRVAAQRVRLRLLRFVRDRCSVLRAELRDAAAAVPAGGVAAFEIRVRDDVGRFMAELDEQIESAMAELTPTGPAERPRRPDIAAAPTAPGRLETRLMAVLGVGFGLGVALASSRLLTGVAPGLAIGGWAAGGALGAAVVVWVVRTRRILHDRALLDRWVSDVAATLRWHSEAAVAERLLGAEIVPTTHPARAAVRR